MDPTRQHSAQPQGMSRDILQDIEEFLEDGRLVFDRNGEHVGDVKMYSTAAGYLFVGSGAFGHQDLYIPFRLIRRIDTQGIVLSEPKDELAAQYTEPPSISTMVENRFVPGPHRDTLPQADEVRVVQSGYDGTPTVVDRIELSSIAERLSVGLAVYDVGGVRLGDITQCDTERCLLMVEKGIFKPTVLIVPFNAIRSIDRDARSVILTLPWATLVQDQATLRSQLE
ncbi:MAG: PRC-barrel domain-containing protein [Ktedonobacterales bacterium]